MGFQKLKAIIERVNTTPTAGGTTVLLRTSQTHQIFDGTMAQNVQLPDATLCPAGAKGAIRFWIANRSTQPINVNYNDTTLLFTIDPGKQIWVRLQTKLTSNGVWDIEETSGGGGAAELIVEAPAGNVSPAELGRIYLMDSNAARNIQLPDPAVVGSGFFFYVKDKPGAAGFGTFPTTILRFAAELFEGLAASYLLEADGGQWFVYTDGVDWFVA